MTRLGSVFGFPLYAQPTFLILIALYVLPNARSLEGLSTGLVSAVIVTLSILVHELGHAFAFRAFGERNATIVLWGLGGLTYGRPPTRTWQNVVVSLAGPAVGLAVGIASLAASIGLGPVDPRIDRVLDQLIWINLAWTFFNLLPLHPLDGGAATRSLLVSWMGRSGLKASLVISIVTAALVGLAAWKLGMIFLMILSVMMLLRNIGELRGNESPLPPAP